MSSFSNTNCSDNRQNKLCVLAVLIYNNRDQARAQDFFKGGGEFLKYFIEYNECIL